jgi:hypothetical protein
MTATTITRRGKITVSSDATDDEILETFRKYWAAHPERRRWARPEPRGDAGDAATCPSCRPVKQACGTSVEPSVAPP